MRVHQVEQKAVELVRKRLSVAFSLRQAVRHRPPDAGVQPQAGVACQHSMFSVCVLAALGAWTLPCQATMPSLRE